MVDGSLGCGKYENNMNYYRTLTERKIIYITFKDFVNYVNSSFDKPYNFYSLVSWGWLIGHLECVLMK